MSWLSNVLFRSKQTEIIKEIKELKIKVLDLEFPFKFSIGDEVYILCDYKDGLPTNVLKGKAIIVDNDKVYIYDMWRRNTYRILHNKKVYPISENELSYTKPKQPKKQKC